MGAGDCLPSDRTKTQVTKAAIRQLCDVLSESPHSPIRCYTPEGADIDTVFDLRAIFPKPASDLADVSVPELLRPPKGKYGLHDYEKVFCAAPQFDIFEARGIRRDKGCLVVLRPDQYVGHLLPLDTVEELGRYFGGFMRASK